VPFPVSRGDVAKKVLGLKIEMLDRAACKERERRGMSRVRLYSCVDHPPFIALASRELHPKMYRIFCLEADVMSGCGSGGEERTPVGTSLHVGTVE
jgi:hypothetical protein